MNDTNGTVAPPNDVCPCCLQEFDDGDLAVVLSCGGDHVLCGACYQMYVDVDERHRANEGQVTRVSDEDGSYNMIQEASPEELARWEQGADRCPVCRGLSTHFNVVEIRVEVQADMDTNDDVSDDEDDVPEIITGGVQTDMNAGTWYVEEGTAGVYLNRNTWRIMESEIIVID